MKKILLIFFSFVIAAAPLMAQESAAKRAFAAGDYSAAVKFYQTAIATVDNAAAKASLNEALAKARVCATLVNRSTTNYNAGNFADAKKYYQTLLSQNPADPSASRMIRQCDSRIANAARNAADNKLWKEIKAENSIAAYKKYIAQYPEGLHAQEAKDVVAENELWLAADFKGTKDAYNDYLSTSKLQTKRAEALHEIALLDDKASWANALQIDTYTGYKQYLSAAKQNAQYKKQAQAKIALFDAMAYCAAGDYGLARSNFEITKRYFSLNDTQRSAYSKCCEETDYESMMQFPLVTKGTAFLANYPNSRYIPNVKNALSRAYCDNREYAIARSYAQNKETLQYIKEQEKKNKKAQRSGTQWAKKYTGNSNSTSSSYSSGTSVSKYKSRSSADIGYTLNIGAEMDLWAHSYSYTVPKIEFSVGNFENRFNFLIGLQYRRLTGWNKDASKEGEEDPFYSIEEKPHLVADQIGLPISVRLNIGSSTASTKGYITLGASVNYNYSSKYKFSYKTISGADPTVVKIKNPDASLVNRINISTFGKIGLCWEQFDFGIFVRYDATPAFNKDAINATISYKNTSINMYEKYKPIRNQTDSKIAVGLSLTWSIPL